MTMSQRHCQIISTIVSAGILVSLLIRQQELTVNRWLTNAHVSNVMSITPTPSTTVRYVATTTPSSSLIEIPTTTNMLEVVVDQKWPSLESLVDVETGGLKQDVQFILDFAIIAHPKCATSFTQSYLASHDEIEMHDHELYAIRSWDPAELVVAMYELQSGPQYKRGFKSPRDVSNVSALNILATYFPKTKLIIGLRHPVLWFESFYNFRLRQDGYMPPVEQLIGSVGDVSTDEARFHANLDNLRKTKRSIEELNLIGGERHSNLPKSPNPVFLYEISQLYDPDETRKLKYVSDLQNYLGLKQEMKELVDKQEKHENPPIGTIDICEHDKVREILMRHAAASSIWIREYFLDSSDVIVSSPDHFRELVKGWMTDPCIARRSIVVPEA